MAYTQYYAHSATVLIFCSFHPMKNGSPAQIIVVIARFYDSGYYLVIK